MTQKGNAGAAASQDPQHAQTDTDLLLQMLVDPSASSSSIPRQQQQQQQQQPATASSRIPTTTTTNAQQIKSSSIPIPSSNPNTTLAQRPTLSAPDMLFYSIHGTIADPNIQSQFKSLYRNYAQNVINQADFVTRGVQMVGPHYAKVIVDIVNGVNQMRQAYTAILSKKRPADNQGMSDHITKKVKIETDGDRSNSTSPTLSQQQMISASSSSSSNAESGFVAPTGIPVAKKKRPKKGGKDDDGTDTMEPTAFNPTMQHPMDPQQINLINMFNQQNKMPFTTSLSDPSLLNMGTPIMSSLQGGAPMNPATGAAPAEKDPTQIHTDGLTDVMEYVGVDLKEESMNIVRDAESQSRMTYMSDVERQRMERERQKEMDRQFVNVYKMKWIMDRITKASNLKSVDNSILEYLSLALQDRLKTLLETVVTVAKHRTGVLNDALIETINDPSTGWRKTPNNNGEEEDTKTIAQMVVVDDLKRVFSTLEKYERYKIELLKQGKDVPPEEVPMSEAKNGDIGVGGNEVNETDGGDNVDGEGRSGQDMDVDGEETGHGDDDGDKGEEGTSGDGTKEKKKREPVISARRAAREMPEHLRNRITNATALMELGGVTKSWMLAGLKDDAATKTGSAAAKKSLSMSLNRATKTDVTPISSALVRKRKAEQEAAAAAAAAASAAGAGGKGGEKNVANFPGFVKLRRGLTSKERRKVTIRDMLFVLERERSRVKQEISTKWWANVK